MRSIVETIRFLGPESCAISVIEGRSSDGTYEILTELKKRIETMGGYFFSYHPATLIQCMAQTVSKHWPNYETWRSAH
jgi:hypothetical protein